MQCAERLASCSADELVRSEHAYSPETNPIQTAGTSAVSQLLPWPVGIHGSCPDKGNLVLFTGDIAALKQAFGALVDILRQTGVGALPLDPPPVPDLRSEDEQIAETTKAVQSLYERQKRIHEGAGVVAGLLSFTAGEQQSGAARRSQM